MPGDFGADETEDEKNNSHKPEELDGAHLHVVDNRRPSHEFLQTDHECQTGILEGNDGLGDQTGQHAPERNGD